jgi:hypothetical protein
MMDGVDLPVRAVLLGAGRGQETECSTRGGIDGCIDRLDRECLITSHVDGL